MTGGRQSAPTRTGLLPLPTSPAAKSLSSPDDARTAPIQSVELVNDQLVLQGGQQGRAWSATVAEKTGQMAVAVVEDQTAFVVFGACTAAEPERR